MTATPHEPTPTLHNADETDPRADSLRAAETPAQPDAEQMESALREHGPLVTDEDHQRAVREQPTEDGPGTSLT
jgi:hypothetical protein